MYSDSWQVIHGVSLCYALYVCGYSQHSFRFVFRSRVGVIYRQAQSIHPLKRKQIAGVTAHYFLVEKGMDKCRESSPGRFSKHKWAVSSKRAFPLNVQAQTNSIFVKMPFSLSVSGCGQYLLSSNANSLCLMCLSQKHAETAFMNGGLSLREHDHGNIGMVTLFSYKR